MIGAIAGDIIGSVHEGAGTKTKLFPLFGPYNRFTDDTVLTVAVAESILRESNLVDVLHDYFHRYPQAGYGSAFIEWAVLRRREPYNSWGNGSAMRVNSVGFAYDALDNVMWHAERTAAVTHNHPEGIRGAQATAVAIYLARTGCDKQAIERHLVEVFGYELSTPLDAIRETYEFDISCQGPCPSRSWRSWKPQTSRTRSATPFRWAVTRIRWRVSRAGLPRRIGAFPRRSNSRRSAIWRVTSGALSASSIDGSKCGTTRALTEMTRFTKKQGRYLALLLRPRQ